MKVKVEIEAEAVKETDTKADDGSEEREDNKHCEVSEPQIYYRYN